MFNELAKFMGARPHTNKTRNSNVRHNYALFVDYFLSGNIFSWDKTAIS